MLGSHPLSQAYRLADHVLERLNPSFCQLYTEVGRSSILPEEFLLPPTASGDLWHPLLADPD